MNSSSVRGYCSSNCLEPTDQRKGVIYAWVNNVNDKVYVGQSLTPRGRYYGHMARFRAGYNHPLYDAMRAHGLASFTYKVIEEVAVSDLDAAEVRWIGELKSNDRNFGYNLESGGHGKGIISEETREKLKLARRRRDPEVAKRAGRAVSRSNRKCWSDAVVQRILQLDGEGLSIRAIGRELDLTTNRARLASIIKRGHDRID